MATDDMDDIDVSASELATRAPENDLYDDSNTNPVSDTVNKEALVEGTHSEEAPKQTMGEHCVSDRPAPSGSKPQGELTTLGGIDTYISTPSSYPSQPARLLLLLSPGTGVRSINNQIQADRWAEKGYVVIMPDQFGGDAAPDMGAVDPESPDLPSQLGTQTSDPTPPPVPSSLLDRLKLTLLETAKSFRIDMWLARHTPSTVLPILSSVLRSASEVYADCISFGNDGIYGAGYCFGGRYALLLAGALDDDMLRGEKDVGLASLTTADAKAAEQEGSEPLNTEAGMARNSRPWLRAAVIAHATGVGKDDFSPLRSGGKIGIVAVREDALFTDEVRDYGVKIARERGVHVEEKVWDGVPHGFAVVGEYRDKNIVRAQAEAFDMMSSFLAADQTVTS